MKKKKFWRCGSPIVMTGYGPSVGKYSNTAQLNRTTTITKKLYYDNHYTSKAL